MSAILMMECYECNCELEGTDLETKGQLEERAAQRGWGLNVKRPDISWLDDDDGYDYCEDCYPVAQEEIREWEEEKQEAEEIEAERRANPPKTHCAFCSAPTGPDGQFDASRVLGSA